MEEQFSLPSSWAWATIDDLGIVASGSTPSTKEEDNFGGDISWLTPADLSNYDGKFIKNGKRNLTEKGLKSCSATLLPEGSILFSSRAPIGYTVIAANPISTNQGFKNLISSKEVFNEYIYHYLKGNKDLAESFASGTTFKELSARRFKKIPVPIPPFNEQVRIVSKIEELFSRLDQGVQVLQQAQQQLEQYKLSIIEKAYNGMLTEKWREANKENISSKLFLMEKIKNKKLSKNIIFIENSMNFDHLPHGWIELSLDDLSWDSQYGTSIKCKYDFDGMPVLRIPNINFGNVLLNDVKYCKDKDLKKKVEPLAPGDFLIIRTNGSRKLIGRAALICQDYEKPHYFASYLIRFRLLNIDKIPKWINLIWNSPQIREMIYEKSATSAGQYNINKTNLSDFYIRIPSLSELQVILDIVDKVSSISDYALHYLTNCLLHGKDLKQRILQKAFEGRIVYQDPHDESASFLLESIKAEKAKLITSYKKRRKR